MDEIMVQILGNSPTNANMKTIRAEFQKYNATIKIEDFEFDITKRLITDYIEKKFEMNGYVKVKDKIYKILKINEYSDYQELWLYKLERQVI